MVIVSYDISDDKLRTKFSKYLSKFGHRLQYSVFEIDNSNRILDNIVTDIKNRFEKCFTQQDSVMVFKLSASCEVLRFGYAKNDENDFFIIVNINNGGQTGIRKPEEIQERGILAEVIGVVCIIHSRLIVSEEKQQA